MFSSNYFKTGTLFSTLVVLFGFASDLTQPIPLVASFPFMDSNQYVFHNLDSLYSPSDVIALYEHSKGKPAWIQYVSSPKRLHKAIELLENAKWEGLVPEHYHLVRIKKLRKQHFLNQRNKTKDSIVIRELDMLLTDAFLTLSRHYYAGKVQYQNMNRDWECAISEINFPQVIWDAIMTNSLGQTLNSLRPKYKQYQLLREQIIVTNKLIEAYPDSTELRDRYSQIAVNMERWRWLPGSNDSIYLIVNIPAFRLWLYQDDTIALSMKTIVGKPYHHTPIFNCEISYIVLRPRWNVPSSIMRNELLPQIIRNPEYLENNHLKIVNAWNDDYFISPDSIAWDSIVAKGFPYKLIQTPGSFNALGHIKLMFPNQFNVYLHDTNDHRLFNKEKRAFSHGCIRLENAPLLGAFLMQNDSLAHTNKYSTYFSENETRVLPKPIQISINYWTAWVKKDSVVFYNDVYNYDLKILEALNNRPPQLW